MKEIFKSLIGMTLITGIYFVFNTLIDYHVPELGPMTSIARGFVFTTLILGTVVISKHTIELIRTMCFNTLER
jgi:hypothetical protein